MLQGSRKDSGHSHCQEHGLSCSSRRDFRIKALLVPGCLAPLGLISPNTVISNICQPLLIGSRRDQGLSGSGASGLALSAPCSSPAAHLCAVLHSETSDFHTARNGGRISKISLKPLCSLRAWKGSPWVEEASANRNLQWSKERPEIAQESV